VIVIEGAEERIETVERFGPDHVVDMRRHETIDDCVDEVERLTEGVGVDVALEVAGVADAFAEGVRYVKNAGKYVEIGNISYGETTEVTPSRITWNNCTVIGIAYYQPWYLGKALDFLAEQIDEYPYDAFLGAEFALEDVEEALYRSEQREVTRAAILPQNGS